MDNFAYAALLFNNEFYYGILLLKRSLDLVKSKYPLVVFYTENVKLEIIQELEEDINCICLPVCMINNFGNKQIFYKYEIFYNTAYQKYCLLDADMLILKNIDHLFTIDKDIVLLGADYNQKFEIATEVMLGSPFSTIGFELQEANKIFDIETKKQLSEQSYLELFLNTYYSEYKNRIYLLPQNIYNCNTIVNMNDIHTIHNAAIIHYSGYPKTWRYLLCPIYKPLFDFIDMNTNYLHTHHFYDDRYIGVH